MEQQISNPDICDRTAKGYTGSLRYSDPADGPEREWVTRVGIEENLDRKIRSRCALNASPDRPAATAISPDVRSTNLSSVASRRLARAVKRTEDIILSLLLLVVIFPALLVLATAVRIDSPGPILFKQRRVGYLGTLFVVYKFRTMYADVTDADCRKQTDRMDPRVTRVGRFLRKHSLDELPQLINVLLGQMSLVGPRPHALATNIDGIELEDLCNSYRFRHLAKPGITGWAQVNGWRGKLDTREKLLGRVAYDISYIRNWSLSLDLLILLRTALSLIRDTHAF